MFIYMPMLNCKRTRGNNSNFNINININGVQQIAFNKPEIEHTHQHNWLSSHYLSHSFLHDDSISIWVRTEHKIRSHLNWCCLCCFHLAITVATATVVAAAAAASSAAAAIVVVTIIISAVLLFLSRELCVCFLTFHPPTECVSECMCCA